MAYEKRDKHPLHLSSSELNYNFKSGTIEVGCRVFIDDFEQLIGKKYKVKADLSSGARHNEMDALIHKYMSTHFTLGVNGKPLPLTYIGFENDKEAIVIYMESAKVTYISKLEVTSTVLYDLFDDQTNIFHMTYKDAQKSSKLGSPDKTLVFSY
ncbi:DUF6702 family protein [Pedobacter sp. L105]|uniref:DUF6702 family protein n=1 Tax=Pedobacter sp. L105 TaxID=1641871 RepID=UPI00131D26A5|nr:DUF6702 family protein [Pedobacter sp. L105]